MKYDKVLISLYPEIPVGGFTRDDEQVIFFSRVRSLLSPDMTVLDYGAGTGMWSRLPDNYKKRLMNLRNDCDKVIGVDLDAGIKENPWLDEAYVIDPSGQMQFPDEYFDMIISWAVFEHINDPVHAASELTRVLKPGGWICAWTPNKWGYVGIGARLIPNKYHNALLKILQKHSIRTEEDVFPTLYRMNTMKDIKKVFPPTVYQHYSYYFNGPPGYYAGSIIFAKLIQLFGRVTPKQLNKSLHIFLKKKGN